MQAIELFLGLRQHGSHLLLHFPALAAPYLDPSTPFLQLCDNEIDNTT